MKVICKSCGKKFDPEKTGHMCPRCGSWYVEKNIDGQFESGAASADSGDYNQDQTSYTEDKNKQYGNVHSEWFKKKEKDVLDNEKRMEKVCMIIIIVFFLIISLGIVYSALTSDHDKSLGFDEESEDEYEDTDDEIYSGDGNYYVDSIPVKGYAFGDKMVNVDPDGNAAWLTIDSVKPIDLEDADIPEGYVVYDMEYEMDAPDDGDSDAEDMSDGGDYFDVYLRSKSCMMLEPMSQENIDILVSYDGYADANDISEVVDADHGHMYFMVRSGDYGYMVVYCQNDDPDLLEGKSSPINNIYVVGEKADASVWYDVSKLDTPKGKLYKLYDGEYGQKIENDKKYTLPGGAEITTDEISYLSGVDFDYDSYDYYLVSDILLNHGARIGSFDIVVIDTGSDTDPIKRTISYGEYTDDALTPMSVVYQYIVYGIPKGQDKIIYVTYEFGSVWDELQHESGRLPVPEQ